MEGDRDKIWQRFLAATASSCDRRLLNFVEFVMNAFNALAKFLVVLLGSLLLQWDGSTNLENCKEKAFAQYKNLPGKRFPFCFFVVVA